MSRYFALVNGSNVVENVIEADQPFIDAHPAAAGKQWIETFMNGENGKNYAGIGNTYDVGIGDFLDAKPYPSWVQSGNTWVPPTARPAGNWKWDENSVSWITTPAVDG